MLAFKKGHNCTFQSMQIEHYNTEPSYLCWGMAVCHESLRISGMRYVAAIKSLHV